MTRIVQAIWWCHQNLAGINTHDCRSWRSGWSPPQQNSALPQKVRLGGRFKIQSPNSPISHHRLDFRQKFWRTTFKKSLSTYRMLRNQSHTCGWGKWRLWISWFWILRHGGLFAVGQNPGDRELPTPTATCGLSGAMDFKATRKLLPSADSSLNSGYFPWEKIFSNSN